MEDTFTVIQTYQREPSKVFQDLMINKLKSFYSVFKPEFRQIDGKWVVGAERIAPAGSAPRNIMDAMVEGIHDGFLMALPATKPYTLRYMQVMVPTRFKRIDADQISDQDWINFKIKKVEECFTTVAEAYDRLTALKEMSESGRWSRRTHMFDIFPEIERDDEIYKHV